MSKARSSPRELISSTRKRVRKRLPNLHARSARLLRGRFPRGELVDGKRERPCESEHETLYVWAASCLLLRCGAARTYGSAHAESHERDAMCNDGKNTAAAKYTAVSRKEL